MMSPAGAPAAAPAAGAPRLEGRREYRSLVHSLQVFLA